VFINVPLVKVDPSWRRPSWISKWPPPPIALVNNQKISILNKIGHVIYQIKAIFIQSSNKDLLFGYSHECKVIRMTAILNFKMAADGKWLTD